MSRTEEAYQRLQEMVDYWRTRDELRAGDLSILLADNQLLKSEVLTLQGVLEGAEKDLDEHEARIKQLEDVLRSVEWAGPAFDYGGEFISTCPLCAGGENGGHAPDCRLYAALRGGE